MLSDNRIHQFQGGTLQTLCGVSINTPRLMMVTWEDVRDGATVTCDGCDL